MFHLSPANSTPRQSSFFAIACLVMGLSLVLSPRSAAQESESGGREGQEQAKTDNREQLEKGVDDARASHFLGIALVDNDGEAYVKEVDPLSPAWNAGVRDGDVIKRFAGFKSEEYGKFLETAKEVVRKREEGERIPITVVRDGEELDFQIVERDATQTEMRENPGQEAEQRNRPATQSAANQTPHAKLLAGGGGAVRALGPRTGGGYGGSDSGDDYYFGSGGLYGSALTSSQQKDLDRLYNLRERGELNSTQQQEFDRLSALENGDFSQLGPLSRAESARLQRLQWRSQDPSNMTSDMRAELRQLTARDLQRNGDIFEQRRRLEQAAEQGQLSPQDQSRLDQLRQIGPSPAERANAASFRGLQQLAGGNGLNGFSADQQRRLEQFYSQRGDLTPQQRAEAQQLAMRQQGLMARQLRAEYQRAVRLRQSSQQLTPQQQARFQQLQQNRRRFSAGVSPAANANRNARAAQAVGGQAQQNIVPGSGGNQPQAGSGVGTSQQSTP